jgi:hypothetical protein
VRGLRASGTADGNLLVALPGLAVNDGVLPTRTAATRLPLQAWLMLRSARVASGPRIGAVEGCGPLVESLFEVRHERDQGADCEERPSDE